MEENSSDFCPILERSPKNKYICFDEKIGEGVSKIVYKGVNIIEMVEIAYNLVSIKNMDIKQKKALCNEVKLLKKLNHKHILKIIDFWKNDNKENVIIITELFPYTLTEYINKYRTMISVSHIKKFCIQILRGLEYLHSHGIIHRDIKCDNIFINSEDGRVVIGDFGLSIENKKPSSIVGTPEFMCKDIYENKYTEKIDIYAFGMCLLFMLTGETPYYECENQAQLYKKVTTNILPLSLNKITDTETKNIITELLGNIRPSASELLNYSFFKL